MVPVPPPNPKERPPYWLGLLCLIPVVGALEFYKLQYGRYPNSLTQLRKADPFVAINDALQTTRIFAPNYY